MDYVVYFDSFGFAPSERIARFLASSGKEIMYNSAQLQDANSILCGVFVVDFIRKLDKKKDLYSTLYEWRLGGNEASARKKFVKLMKELEE
jgi:hypothetical protein